VKKFLLVDDHVVIRSGMRILLQDICSPCEIHEAFDEKSVLVKLKEHVFDMIIMDIQMPETDTLNLMEFIHKNHASSNVLVFSMSAENVYAKRFLKAGAKGFISKEAPFEEIKKAILHVLDNKSYVSELMAETLATGTLNGSSSNPFSKLSSREFEILSLLLAGHTITDISKSLQIGLSTAGTYKTRLFEKLGTKNLLELKELASLYNL